MQLAVTVNLGNYENIRVESGEWPTIDQCKNELDFALATFDEPRVDDFRKRVLTVEA